MARSRPTVIYQIKVTLLHTKPPIWRRLQVPSSLTLSGLHHVLQIAMGWEDDHLHEFEIADVRYSYPSSDPFGFPDEVRDEVRFRLNGLGLKEKSKFKYLYDFGDSWLHQLLVEKVLPVDPDAQYPVCVAGRRAGPPEDCGGAWGYANMLGALADPAHENYEEYADWFPAGLEPEAFDVKAINARLAARASAARGESDHITG